MKKAFILTALCIVTALTLLLAACRSNTDVPPTGVDISSTVFNVNGELLTLTVSNDTEEFSFDGKIQLNERATYTVASDSSGQGVITSKTVALNEGDNTFYIIANDGVQQKTYTVQIRRRPMYTVEFNTNGGLSIESIRVEENNTVSMQEASRNGYTFECWTVNGKTVAFPYTVNENTFFNAEYSVNEYKIEYNLNGGENSQNNLKSYTVEDSVVLSNPTRSGYSFLGWFAESTFETEVTSIEVGSIGDKQLYAKWQALENKLAFDGNGADSGSIDDIMIATDSTITLPLSSFVKDGYTFKGWSTYADGSVAYEDGASYKMGAESENILYAVWMPIEYKILYKLDGGVNNSDNPSTYTKDVNVVLQAPTKDGYEFLGWYRDSKLTTKVTGISAGTKGDKVFYAKWTPNSNVLIFNANGGEGTMSDMIINTDETQTLISNVFEKAGYTFKGWSTVPDGQVEYEDGASYKMGTLSVNTLYAVWEETRPTDVDITLFSNGSSEYTIVYPKNNIIIENQVKEYVDYIKATYGVQIPYKAVDKEDDVSEKEIIIGFVRKKVSFSTEQMDEKNDFVLDVCGDDFVICAPNDALYSYALRVFRDEVLSKTSNSNKSLTVKSNYTFSYKNCSFRSMNYASYVKAKAGASSFNSDLLCDAFVGMSFTASDDSTTLPYRLYLPSNYDASYDYPVIVFLHGAGERGTDNKRQMINMLPALFNHTDSYLIQNAIIVVPQCPSNQQWVDTPWENGNYDLDLVPESNELKAVVELLGFVENQFSTDVSRYYAMGISMGGFGTWDLLMRHGNMFAAGVPVCGGADLNRAELLKNTPIYTAHGTWDTTVPYDNSTKLMVQALKDAGSTSVIYKEYSAGHVMWDNVAREGDILSWLFAQKKVPEQIGPNDTPVVPRKKEE